MCNLQNRPCSQPVCVLRVFYRTSDIVNTKKVPDPFNRPLILGYPTGFPSAGHTHRTLAYINRMYHVYPSRAFHKHQCCQCPSRVCRSHTIRTGRQYRGNRQGRKEVKNSFDMRT